ncbi:MAG: HAD hydrolase family protein [Thermoleophilia bacterium]
MSDDRVVYLDLDGTLFGRGGSLLHDGDGAFTDAGVRALRLLDAAGVPVVLVSGRSRSRLESTAQVLGVEGFLAEMGACDCGYPTQPGQSVHQAIAATGIVDELLAREPRLEPHRAARWARDGSHIFQGRVADDAADWVRTRSGGALRLADNGRIGPDTHVFHLLPAGASKAAAVATDLARRGIDGSACLAVGDSAEDLAMGGRLGFVALVRNGADADPRLAARAPWVTRGRHGAGVLEAVEAWLSGSAPGR